MLFVLATAIFLLHSVCIPCVLFFSFLRFGVVGLFGRVSFAAGCFKGFRCPPVFLWVGGFLLEYSQGFLEWVYWWCEIFLSVVIV